MPTAPIGTRPSSTFAPDSRPAARLPKAMPMAMTAPSNCVSVGWVRSTWSPNSGINCWIKAPTNQK